jgi:hypothetical protein
MLVYQRVHVIINYEHIVSCTMSIDQTPWVISDDLGDTRPLLYVWTSRARK